MFTRHGQHSKARNPHVHEASLRNQILQSEVKPHRISRVRSRFHKYICIEMIADSAKKAVAQLLMRCLGQSMQVGHSRLWLGLYYHIELIRIEGIWLR